LNILNANDYYMLKQSIRIRNEIGDSGFFINYLINGHF